MVAALARCRRDRGEFAPLSRLDRLIALIEMPVLNDRRGHFSWILKNLENFVKSS